MNRKKALKILKEYFNESEIKEICFELEIDYENLAHNNKADLARELIVYLQNRDRLEDLEKVICEKRPHLCKGYARKNMPKENVKTKIEEVIKLIKEDRIELAMTQLEILLNDIGNDEHREPIIQNKAQYNRLKKDVISNTITREQANTEKARITRNMLGIIDSIQS